MTKLGIQINRQNCGKRIDTFLSEKYARISRSQWQQRIAQGHVRVNGLICRAGRKLRVGDVITFEHERLPEPNTAVNYRILYEDAALLLINKPPNLPIHPSGRYRNHTLYAYLLRDFLNEKIHFVNRLDRETSGLVLIAKHASLARTLQQQLQQKIMQKEYLTVVWGNFPDYWDAKGFIGETKNSLVRKKRSFLPENHIPPQGWQSCHSEFFCLKRKDGLSLLKVKLHTGRMHQIRATLCSLGFPIVGDTLYGIDQKMYLKFIAGQMTEDDWQNLGGPRSMLHAYRLSLIHPTEGREVTFEAPPPEDFPLI